MELEDKKFFVHLGIAFVGIQLMMLSFALGKLRTFGYSTFILVCVGAIMLVWGHKGMKLYEQTKAEEPQQPVA